MVRLDRVTRLDAASDFFGLENVPTKAITMGVGTIMAAKRILLMAWGEGKSGIIRQAVEGKIRESVPATFLQHHGNCEVILDQAAASSLTRVDTPWLVSECQWDDALIKRATIWLSEKLSKAILKLTNEDYNEHGMGNLIAEIGSAEDINLRVFNALQRTITGWPGGKPNADDSNRPERRERAVAVTTTLAQRTSLVVPVIAEGVVRARHTAEIKFELAGRLMEVHVQEGQRVRKGQRLATLDDREYVVESEEARANTLDALGKLAVEEQELGRTNPEEQKKLLDEVRYNDRGNSVTLVLRFTDGPGTRAQA